MTIIEQLKSDMKSAMKSKDKARLTTIRMTIDRIQKKEKDLLRELSEEEVVQALQTFKKQIDEEAAAFLRTGNYIKAAELKIDIELLNTYLPEQMTEGEIVFQVGIIISGLAKNAQVINKGSVMKGIMPFVKGKADNKLVGKVVDQVLEGVQ